MSDDQYVALAYAVGSAILWGYGLFLWSSGRALARRRIRHRAAAAGLSRPPHPKEIS